MKLQLCFPEFKTKALTLSYDDGAASDRKMVSILDKYGIKCTFNLCSGFLKDRDGIKAREISELYKNHEIASHTASHFYPEDITSDQLAKDILDDRLALETITGKIVDGLAYPFGLHKPEREPKAAKMCGIKYARTVNSTCGFELPEDLLKWNPTCHHDSPRLFELWAEYLNVPDWRTVLFYLWGHSFEFENNSNWEHLEDFCKTAGQNAEIWYATNGEIADYISAYRMMRKSCDGNLIYNFSPVKLYVICDGEKAVIEPGAVFKKENVK